MNTIQAGCAYTASGDTAIVLVGNDTVVLGAGNDSVVAATGNFGSDLITGGDWADNIALTGGHDTVALGNGNVTVTASAAVPQAFDQQIAVGGIQGFADLSNAANSTALLATGRVAEYLHWASLVDAATGEPEVPGAQATAQQIAAMQAVFADAGGALAELDYNAGPAGYFAGLYAADFAGLGFHPSDANVNMFDLWQSPTGVAGWVAYVDQARDAGLRSVAPIYSPNDLPEPVSWSDPMFAPIRAMALYGGAIGIDAPPSFFFAQSQAYQQFTIDEIKWGVANGLRVSVIVSPYSGNFTFLADTQKYVRTLVAAGAIPTQWVAENYDVNVPQNYPNRLGSEDQVNTIDNIALWLARNAPTVPQTVLGNDQISVGRGNDSIALAPYDALVAGSGADTITSAGHAAITVGGGSGTLTLGAQDGVMIGGGRYAVALGGGDTVAATSGVLTVVGGAATGLATDVIMLAADFASIAPGAQSVSVSGGAGRLVVSLGAGGGTVQGGTAGGNALSAGSGAALLIGGGPGDTLTGGSGADTITTCSQGGCDVLLGSGVSAVTLHPGDTLIGGAGAATVSPLNNDVVVFGTGPITAAIGTGNVITAGGSLARVVAAPAGNNTISGAGGTGPEQFTGGSGFDVLRAGGGTAILALGAGGGQEYAGSGNATLLGGSGAVTMTGGGGGTVFIAGSGSTHIVAGSGPGTIWIGSGPASVQLQSGPDTVILGTGSSVIYAGSAPDVFGIAGTAGTKDILYGFKLGVDALTAASGIAVTSEQFVGGAAVIKLSDGVVVSIYGGLLSAAHLPAVAH